MLRRVDYVSSNADVPTAGHGAMPTGADLSKVIAFVKASKRIIICWIVLGLASTLAYSLTAVPEYTAVANLLMDAHKFPVFKSDNMVADNAATDAPQVESQAEIIRSKAIAAAVVDKLKLGDDPEFSAGKPNFVMALLGSAIGLAQDQKVKSGEERDLDAVLTLQSRLNVRRIGVTYVLEISFRSTSPEKAARIANAVADSYLVNQLETKYEATKRASLWLQDRLQDLRSQSTSAARAVQEYKAKNNIIDTGAGGLLGDRQLSELNSQLIIATAHTAEMQAKYERVENVLNSPKPDEVLGTVSDTLTNAVILKLREQFLDARKREADISTRFGENHVSAVNLRNDMRELQRSITLELRRIADSYKSDFEIAKTREESIRVSLQDLVKQSDTTGQAQVALKELESSANTYRTIFENFLQKYTEAAQQQSFPISEAQLISRADPPVSKSFPKTTLLVLLGLLVGGGCGVAHSVVVRNLDRTLRTPREFEDRFGIDCLSLIPILADVPAPTDQPLDQRKGPRKKRRALTAGGQSGLDAILRNIDSKGPNRKSVTAPLSRFTESVRSVKTSIDIAALTRSIKVIGILSSVPNEGKSTISANLANLFAKGGQKTLLIDGDLRNPSLSQDLAPAAMAGLLEVIQGTANVDDVLWTDHDTGLKFLPAVTTRRLTNSGDVLGSERMKSVLNSLSGQFDYIIMDLPPIGAVVDARAVSPQIDGFIMVVEWGKTRVDVVNEALMSLGVICDKIIGAVLNKVNYRALNNIDGYSPGYYHNESYGRYTEIES
jgi:succinoglycan biosynthesis transport protein ExoP